MKKGLSYGKDTYEVLSTENIRIQGGKMFDTNEDLAVYLEQEVLGRYVAQAENDCDAELSFLGEFSNFRAESPPNLTIFLAGPF